MKTAWLVASALTLLSLDFVVACGTSVTLAEDTSAATLEVPVSFVGPDRATYSLPVGTALVLTQDGTLVACGTVTSSAPQTFDVPAGTYQLRVQSSCSAAPALSDGGAAPVVLTREADGDTASIPALLEDPVQTLDVTDEGTTEGVLHLNVAQLGASPMVTGSFMAPMISDGGTGSDAGTGSRTVAMSDDASVTVAPTQAGVEGTFGTTTFAAGPDAIAAVTALLRPLSTETISISGPISALAPNSQHVACASFTPSLAQVASVGDAGTLTPGNAALFQEATASGATGSVCISPPSTEAGNAVVMTFSRTGTATTSAFQGALAPDAGGTGRATFEASLEGYTPSAVYDGGTLAAFELESPVALATINAYLAVINPADGQSIATVSCPAPYRSGSRPETAFATRSEGPFEDRYPRDVHLSTRRCVMRTTSIDAAARPPYDGRGRNRPGSTRPT